MSDHYQTLGIRRDATKAEVKSAFRRSALRDHPDRHAGSTDAAARADAARRFSQASDAYHVLSDDRRRAEYDLRLRGSTSSYARTSSSGWTSSSSASYGYGYGHGHGHGGGSWRRTPPGAGAGASVGSIDWEFLLKAVTRRGFLINLGFASVLLSGAAFLDGSILEIWKMNNSGVEIQELRQINPLHTSHVFALSQACPGNLGVILTPLDLCDGPSNSDALSIGYPGSHTSGLALPNNNCSVGPTLPNSNMNVRLPGSPGMVLGSNSPLPLNAPSRDAQRYGVPRPTSIQGDEQSRIHYNQMVNGRNLHQPGVPVPGVLPSGVDRGARMMPPAHGVGMMTGLNRGTPVTRPGFPRLGSPGNMSPNNGQGFKNTVNVHPGAIPGPGSTMLRPRDPMQMLRPGQNSEEHRQMMMPEFQLQVSQGNNHAVHFSGPPYSNTGASSPVQSFPVQQSQPHQMPQQSHMYGNTHLPHTQGTNQSNPQQQQAYAMRLAKERHIQQMMPQQQRPLSGASAVSAVQNGSQMQQQSQGSATGVIPATQPQHKQQHPSQNAQGNPMLPHQPSATTSHKQKKQQGQQQPRQNQQQRNQGSQQAKLMKSLGRGNMVHQSPVDISQTSGISTSCKNQVPDKNVMQQGPGHFVGSKGSIPSISQPGNQPKVYTSQMPVSSMQTPDISNQGAVKGSSNHTLLTSQQGSLHSPSQLAQQQQQQQLRYMNPSQNNIQRLIMQQNRHVNTDGRIELPVDQVQHNQVMSSASLARSTDSGSPGISSISQRKQESAHDPSTITSSSPLASSPQDTFVGSDKLLPSSSQSMLQRQMSGGVPIHGLGIGGQVQLQQSRQQLQSQQQQQQRPVVQGGVYSHPSNSGPG